MNNFLHDSSMKTLFSSNLKSSFLISFLFINFSTDLSTIYWRNSSIKSKTKLFLPYLSEYKNPV